MSIYLQKENLTLGSLYETVFFWDISTLKPARTHLLCQYSMGQRQERIWFPYIKDIFYQQVICLWDDRKSSDNNDKDGYKMYIKSSIL